jgi:hypothetical protein
MARTASKNNAANANLGYEAQLWQMADALRNNMDAAEYKHVVLGLIFLKYISDAFEAKHADLVTQKAQGADPEDRDEYRAASIFWVPKEARWQHLKANAPQPTIGTLIDDAMAAIERDNPSLKGVLPKDLWPPRPGQTAPGPDHQFGERHRPRQRGGQGQGYAGPRVRVLPVPIRQRRGQEWRPVLHTPARGACAGGDARPVQGPCLRPLLRLGRHVRAEREVHRGARRQTG